MMKHNLILILAAALLLSGCKQSSGITYTPPALEDGWSVKMTLSGGIAGLMRVIDVQSDGKYTVTDERAKDTSTGKLTDQELSELKKLITEMKFTAPQTDSGCADCFGYSLEIESGGRKMIAGSDDVTLGDSGMEPLVDYLRGLMDTALK